MSGIVHPCKIYGALSIGRPVLTLGPKESYLSDIIRSEARDQKPENSSTLIPAGVSGDSSPPATNQNTLNSQPLTLDSEERQSHSSVGWAVEHGDVAACVAALRKAIEQTENERATMGKNAQEIAKETFARSKLIERFLGTVLA
jgi:hypothetical protein